MIFTAPDTASTLSERQSAKLGKYSGLKMTLTATAAIFTCFELRSRPLLNFALATNFNVKCLDYHWGLLMHNKNNR